jgi:hypothetical protein
LGKVAREFSTTRVLRCQPNLALISTGNVRFSAGTAKSKGVRMRILWSAGMILVVAGCVAQPEVPPQDALPTDPAPSCAASGLSDLIGKSANVLETVRFAAEVRILHPGDMMTMDYNAARTNIMIDDKNIITTITCG